MTLSIKVKMIAAFLALIILPITILGVLSYRKTEAILLEKAKEQSLQAMESARVFFIENYLLDVEEAVDLFASNPALRELRAARGTVGEPLSEWGQYRRFRPELSAIYFANTEGHSFVSSMHKIVQPIDPRKRPWYQRALENPDQTVWTGVYLDALTFRSVVTAARVVKDEAGLFGVIGIDTSLFRMADIIKKIKFEQGGYAVLIDQRGQVIAHPDTDLLGRELTDESWFWEIRNRFKGALVYNVNGQSTVISYITIPQTGWKLIGFIPQASIEQEISPIKMRTIGIGALAALLASGLAIFIASGVAARLRGLVDAMTRVEKGDFSARWQDYSSKEFGELSDKFTAMVSTLEVLIDQQHASQHQIALQKVYFEQLFGNSPESIAIIDQDDRVVRVNHCFTRMFGYSLEEANGRYINDLVVPEELREEGIAVSNAVLSNNVIEQETLRMRKDGRRLEVFVIGYPIVVLGKMVGGYVIYRDISERKEAERQLTYASTHDLLTGVFNRGYFEQEMHRLESGDYRQAGVIITDIDGLKLVNDTLGHAVGDGMLQLAARIIRASVPDNAVICRIGGDEFAVLLQEIDEAGLQEIGNRIKAAVAAENEVNKEFALSMSVGYAVRRPGRLGMDDAYREADSCMYREKLHRSSSARSALVKTLTEALHARDFITEGHADRLQELVEKLARAVGISERRIGDLRLLAQFHDIGKVGIPDNILFKPGRLTDAEMMVMRRHSEIGYRIAVASPDFHHIADWILKHHEWWDGGGYPLGLKGEEIPIECRILLIADAFDAMTQDRPYRRAVSTEKALKEIAACKERMFDPYLAERFIALFEDGRQP